MNRTYTIRQLTKEFCVTARTLRFYEDEGLVAPERRGQTRIYSVRDRARIILILRGRRVGFSLAEIRQYLELYDHDSSVKQLQHVRQKFQERVAILERQKVEIDAAIVEIQRGIAEVEQRLAGRAQHQGAPAHAFAAA